MFVEGIIVHRAARQPSPRTFVRNVPSNRPPSLAMSNVNVAKPASFVTSSRECVALPFHPG